MSPHRVLLVAAMIMTAVVASVAPAGIVEPVGAAPKSPRAAGAGVPAALYAVPDPLPAGPPGALIRAVELSGSGLPGHTWFVMYHSRSVRGDDIAVTGIVVVPAGSVPAGDRAVVSWAHGTTGIADVCAPSHRYGDSSFARVVAAAASRGFVMAATDYEGLGTPGRHPHLVGESEARGVIDIVRAARELPGSAASSRYAVWGHSQGGHAGLFAAQIASAWAPELHLVGVVTSGAPSQLRLAFPLLINSPFRADLILTAAGYQAAYGADLHQVMTDEAFARLHAVDEGCYAFVNQAYGDLPGARLAKADPYTIPAWKRLIDANEPGTQRTAAPLLMLQGTADEEVPAVASDLLLQRLCPLGQVVERRLLPGATHGGSFMASLGAAPAWIADRLAGKPASTSCQAAPATSVPASTAPPTNSAAGSPPPSAAPAQAVAGRPSFTG